MTAPAGLDTSDFACSHGVCEAGPGNVGVAFEAMLFGIGGPVYTGPECNPFLISVAGGSLPPGLQLGEPDCTWLITGTPAKVGRYAFTVKITPQPNSAGQPGGPSGTQRLSITIGTGHSDRLVGYSAHLNPECGSYEPVMDLFASDANSGVTYTVTQTSTGTRIATFTGNSRSPGGVDHRFAVPSGTFPFGAHPGSVTVTGTLSGSATIPVTQISGC